MGFTCPTQSSIQERLNLTLMEFNQVAPYRDRPIHTWRRYVFASGRVIDLLQSRGRTWYRRLTVLRATCSVCVRQVLVDTGRPGQGNIGHVESVGEPPVSGEGYICALGRDIGDLLFLCSLNVGVKLFLEHYSITAVSARRSTA